MNFLKLSFYLSILFLVKTTMVLSNNSILFFSFKFYMEKMEMLEKMNFSLMFDYNTMFFIMMVTIVSIFVSLYSELYMEHYNQKKYLILMTYFFISMILLSVSSSPILLMMSWDFLGISSIFLIIFYTNMKTVINSIWTMMFNRLGDYFMMLILSHSILMNFLSYNMNMDSKMFLFMIFCMFTKSAQFPFSIWLPMAMSAPTPISAMVHSSTLVTAGLFIFLKTMFLMNLNNMMTVKILTSLTFIYGGIMACMEKDLKKMIAFSTMSQISMLMVFLSNKMLILSLTHTIFHAFFKSYLFMVTGLLFSFLFMTQNYLILSMKNLMKTIKVVMMMNLFMMSGLMYSYSFLSKDLILEMMFSELGLNDFFFLMIFGSIFTMMYCMKIMGSTKNFYSKNMSAMIKNMKNMNIYFFLMLLIMILMNKVEMNIMSFMNSKELIFMNLIFIFFMILNIKNFLNKVSMEMFWMKLNYNYLKKLFNILMNIFFSDLMIFKKYYLKI